MSSPGGELLLAVLGGVERYDRPMVTDKQTSSGGRLFAVTVAVAAVGGAALYGGISLILGRTGNASTYLADLGMLLLIGAGVANLAAIAIGLRFMLLQRVFLWWWPISVLLAVAAVAGGVVAINL